MTAALNKWDILDSPEIHWKPHNAQVEVMSSAARFRLVAAGRRFGKSEIGGHELIPEFFLTHMMQNYLKEKQKRREFWVVGPEYSDSEKEFRIIWNSLKALDVPFDKPGSYYNPENGALSLSCCDGTFLVHGKSAKYPGTLVGEGLAGVILAEAAKLKKIVWTKYIQPTLADLQGWALLTSTPEGRNWFHEMYLLGKDPRNRDWASWKYPAWVNHFVYRKPTETSAVRQVQEILRRHDYPSQSALEKMFKVDPEILSRLMSMTDEMFNQEIAADFTDFVGRVFKQFDEDYHVRDLKFNPEWRTFACVDYGFTNPNVWLLCQEGYLGEINVLDEFYMPGLTPVEFAAEVKARGLCPSSLQTFYPDPASPGDTRQLEKSLRVKHTPSSDKDGQGLKERIDAIRAALKPMLHHIPADDIGNRPRLLIDRKCTNMAREFGVYRYPETRGEDKEKNGAELPMKKDDHTPEALGRFFAATGTPAVEASRSRVSNVHIGG